MKSILFALLPGLLSCSQGADLAVNRLFGVSAEAPVFLSCASASPDQVDFAFSLPVKVGRLNFEPPLAVASITEGERVRVTLHERLAPGERVAADILVEDSRRNTLNVLVPFRARNDRLPGFIITELRTEYSKPKVEFVEIKITSAGNLGALRLFIGSSGMEAPVFEFPPTEVRAGEYVVIHLRTIEEGLVNEAGADLAASKGADALPDARDFWVSGSKKRLRSTDAVFFMDQDGRVLDAVVMSASPDTWGGKTALPEVMDFLSQQGAWAGKSAGFISPADGVASKGATATRTVCRDEAARDTNRAGNWYIAATRGATPGKPNTTRRF
ncbi:MAG: hypothetical protein LBD13_02540 [Spirochaetaceae bacterium]|jgi:hypothetical protein|nr:hypothetical protein [Spirochaetaceae bacterium]